MPTPAARRLILTAVGVGTFMSALDGSVVNTTLPLIAAEFGAGVAAAEWIVSIYLLALSALLLGFGRLGDLHGHKRVYIAGIGVFLCGSIACGLATSTLMLVIFRVLQAVGGAMLASNSPAILTKSFPAASRGRALGIQATMTYLGLTVGPSLGGWLAESFTWRAVFYINVPVCLAALALSRRSIPADHPKGAVERFDRLGALLFGAALTALMFALNRGHALGWTSPAILACFLVAAVAAVAFISVERRAAAPMLDLRLFRHPVFSASTLSAVLNYIGVYTITFLMPFYLLQGRQLSPSQAGLLLTAMPIVMAIVAPLSGALSDRIGARLPTSVGMALLTAGMLLLAGLDGSSSTLRIAASLAVAGLGIGIFISPNNSALMGSAPRGRQGIAAGILATARNAGMALGVGLAGAIFTTLLERGGEQTGDGIFNALRYSFIAAAIVAAVGLLVSLQRSAALAAASSDGAGKPGG